MSKVTHRFFFALLPPLALQSWLLSHAYGARTLMKADRLHLTLAITDDYALPFDQVIRTLIAIGGSALGAGFDIPLSRVTANDYSVTASPAGRSFRTPELQRYLEDMMRRDGLLREGWTFSPHLTVGYQPRGVFSVRTLPASWSATEFVLIHSLVGLTQHRLLGRWPLLPPPQLSLFG